MERVIKIVLAILFFICLADMPYGYYQFIRFAALIGFAILAYQAHAQGMYVVKESGQFSCRGVNRQHKVDKI